MSFGKALGIFAVLVLLSFLALAGASFIQTDFGRITVQTGVIEGSVGRAGAKDAGLAGAKDAGRAGAKDASLGYKLFIPQGADADHPVPAVLVMHGYQNDRETSAAYGIELARRGIAALSLDLYGHGYTAPGMRERGWAEHTLKNPDKPIAGPGRFHIFMTFSILDFFKDRYSAGLKDTSMGGRDGYFFLQSLPFVDPDRIGITGHSMGTWASWSVAAAFPRHRAVVLQCGEIPAPGYYDSEQYRFNNVMMIQARWDEFDYFRDFQKNVLGLEKTPLRYRDFMGQDAPVEWNKTYGSFAEGSARRMELLQTNHRLATHSGRALSAAMSWFTSAFGMSPGIADSNHTYLIRELLILAAMLAALASLLPLFILLTGIPFFAGLVQPLPDDPLKVMPGRSRIRAVLIAVLLSGFTFPFLCQLGHGLLPVPENIFRMTIGTGFITWLGFLMILSLIMLIHWYKKGKGKALGFTLYDLGLGNPDRPTRFDLPAIGKSVLAALILSGFLYLLTVLAGFFFSLDYRFIWPFFKTFTPARFGQFLVYLPFYAAFFTVNGGARLYGQLKLREKFGGKNSRGDSPRTMLVWWGYSVLVMLGGVFIMVLIEYIPFFLGLGPGADLLFSSLFGGPYMSVMILLIPQFAVFFFLSTWLYRKSGKVWTGSFLTAILASWVLAGGSAMF
jgi:dienelactone hydrolase